MAMLLDADEFANSMDFFERWQSSGRMDSIVEFDLGSLAAYLGQQLRNS